MKKKKQSKFVETRCPFGHELYSISVTSSHPFCPVCGWIGEGSLFSKEGQTYWIKCSNMSYIDYSNMTTQFDKIGILYEKNKK